MNEKEFEFSDTPLEFNSQPDSENEKNDKSEKTLSDFETNTDFGVTTQSESESVLPRNQNSGFASDSENSPIELDFVEDVELDFTKLPQFACKYCGIHCPEGVVKCDTCNKWFCNSDNTTSGSHIINHLVRSSHKTVSLHEKSPLGETVLECFNCGTRNVFLLGFIPAKNESIIVLLCREPCLTLNALKEMNWDLSQWSPLIKDRKFLSWLVKEPDDKDINRSINVNSQQIKILEEMWDSGVQDATITDVERKKMEERLEPVLVKYEDGFQYKNIFEPLISLDKEYNKKMTENQGQRGLTIKWDVGLNNKKIFYFRKNSSFESNFRVVIGDEIIVKYPGDHVTKPWESKAVVIKITTNEEFVAEILSSKDCPVTQTHGFDIDFVWRPVPFNRALQALRNFAEDDHSVTGYLYHALLGHEIPPQSILFQQPTSYNAPGLPKLNESQIAAVRHALEQPLSLVQGPPGTGKTVTSASLVYHLAKQNRGQILVCAPSNIGVDQLAAKLHETGLNVVRISSRTRETVGSFVDFLYLDVLVKQLAEEIGSDLHKLELLKDIQGELSNADQNRYCKIKEKFETELLQTADVICTTCVGAGDRRLNRFRFKQVVIDESTQATEPECMIPISKGAKQIVLIGDHCQLGPVIMCQKAADHGLKRSLFERLIMLGIRPIRLQVQYRMHPCLSEFPSNTFYEGSLQNGVSVEDRNHKSSSFEWPDPQTPMFFFSSIGQEEFSASGTSYLNRLEAANVEKLVTKMMKSGLRPEQIGIITPYEGQRQYIIANMLRTGSLNKNWYENLEVANVDSYQGREKDYIILSCVRSNENMGIGFLSDPRRLNVALTRAKYGLVLVGNPKVLSKQPLWHSLLTHFKNNKVLVEGTLDDLRQSFVRLSEPSDYYERKRLYAEDLDNNDYKDDADYQRQFPMQTGGNLEITPGNMNINPGEIVLPPVSGIRSRRLPRPSAINRPPKQIPTFKNGILTPDSNQHSSLTQYDTSQNSSKSVDSFDGSQNSNFPSLSLLNNHSLSFSSSFENTTNTQNTQNTQNYEKTQNFDQNNEKSQNYQKTMEKTQEISQLSSQPWDKKGDYLNSSGESQTQFGSSYFSQSQYSQNDTNLQSQKIEKELNELSLGGYSQELNLMDSEDENDD